MSNSAARDLRSFVLEAAAVLAGILAAFGLDAAWQARGEAVRTDAYIEALSSELARNRAILVEDLAEHDEEFPRVKGYFDSVVGADSATADEVIAMIRLAGPLRFDLERVALSDFLASGGLEQVRDPEIRRGIADYELRVTQTDEANLRFQQHWNDFMSPYYIAHASLPDMFNAMDDMFDEYRFPEGRFDIDVEAFAGNRDYANRFASHMYRVQIFRNRQRQLLASLDELSRILER